MRGCGVAPQQGGVVSRVEGKGRRIEARGENRRESNKLGETKCAEDVIKVSGVSALLAAGRQRRR